MAEKVIESGDLYFFYRPKRHDEIIRSLDDIESFYMVMAPLEHELFRLLSIGQKKLPKIPVELLAYSERDWAIVDYVTKNSDDLREVRLDRGRIAEGKILYPTRPAGVAKYQLVLHKNETFLAYSLEVPTKLGPVQNTFDILLEAAHIFKVKNPDYLFEGYPGIVQKPEYPVALKGLFDEDMINVKDYQLLNYRSVQILLIGAYRHRVERALGIGFFKESAQKAIDRLYGTFHMRKEDHPLAPLVEGQWLEARRAA